VARKPDFYWQNAQNFLKGLMVPESNVPCLTGRQTKDFPAKIQIITNSDTVLTSEITDFRRAAGTIDRLPAA
jgi:hypothetical protein